MIEKDQVGMHDYGFRRRGVSRILHFTSLSSSGMFMIIMSPAIVAMKARMTTKKSTMLCQDGQLKKTFGVRTTIRMITFDKYCDYLS